MRILDNPTVGNMIHELYMKPTNLSVEGASELCNIPPDQFQRILEGTETVGYELSYKLAQGFRTSYTFWLHLAQDHQIQSAADTESRSKDNTNVSD